MAERPHRRPTEHPHAPPPELSRKVWLHQLEGDPIRLEIEANPEELEALRRRFDLEALQLLRAEVELARLGHADAYRLDGNLRAAVTQVCVVTLDPLENTVEGPFTTTYVRVEEPAAQVEPMEVGGDLDEDEPEEFSGDFIDVGEAVVQEFASMLDPYPRHPDAVVEQDQSGDEEPPPRSPFAVLEKLKSGGKSEGD